MYAVFPNKLMSPKSLTDKLLPTLATWELADLQELQAALGGLIETLDHAQGNPESTATDQYSSQDELEQAPAKGARGHIETKYIPRGNKRHGPYLYLRYWQGGKLRSKYLGKPQQK